MKFLLLFLIAVTLGLALGGRTTIKQPPLCCGWQSEHLQNYAGLTDAKPLTVSVTLSLKQRNLDVLKNLVSRISDPTSPEYGNFLRKEQINDLTSPKKKSFSIVEKWLKTNNISNYEFRQEEVLISAVIPKLEQVFETQFLLFINTETGQKIVRAGDFSVPFEVHNEVAAYFGFHGLPLPPRTNLYSYSQSIPVEVTPSVIEQTYSISGVKPQGDGIVRQAVAEFQGQYEKDEDLAEFFSRFVPKAKPGDERISQFVGDPDKQIGGIEASLDIQYIMGVAPHVQTEFWMYANYDFCNDLRIWTNQLLDNDDVPFVHSISYGWQGDLQQVQCEADKVLLIDTNFAKIAAKGLTIIFSSGDSGSGYMPRTTCREETVVKNHVFVGEIDGSFPSYNSMQCCFYAERRGNAYSYQPSFRGRGNCTLFQTVVGKRYVAGATSGGWPIPIPKLYPSWPASSPYVTSVGATRFVDQVVGNEEMASDQFGSGGGFSDMFKRNPAAMWQEKAVREYFSNSDTVNEPHFPPQGSFPADGRATPDVSVVGEGYQVVINGKVVSIGGTSASAPAFAAMISLINEARYQRGMKSLGFLNPFLYQNSDAFKDVVIGTNAIGRGTGPVRYGFNCTKGWDPATGLGTPIFPKLLQAALATNRQELMIKK